jgi:hypothetical protein
MKKSLLQVFWCLLLLMGLAPAAGFSQVITSGPDSTLVRSGGEPVAPKEKGLSKPGKAALMSAIVPGLGQAYNHSYWKIPIIYAAGGVLGYFLRSNNQHYKEYQQGIRVRLDADTTNDVDQYTTRLRTLSPEQTITALKRGRDTYRRWRDYNVMYCILAYGLNITEAYVHAHLKGFDVSDELSMRIEPNFIQTSSYSFTPAFTLSINLKK